MQKQIKKIVFFVIIFLASLGVVENVWAYGDYQEFEIIAPKEAGTGSPAIPETHRCFRAYPGITYIFRAQVIGGTYPYVFSLSNAPTGMIIDNHTGVITWTNPQESANNISMTVYDKNGHSVSSTWDITVGTEGWYFVDDSAIAGGIGTIDSPFNSLDNILNTNDEDGMVYFRSGNYTISTYHPIFTGWQYGSNINYNSSPHIWIAYPEETVTFFGYNIESVSQLITPLYLDGLIFSGHEEHVIISNSSNSYLTIINCEFTGLSSGSINSNQGASIYTPAGGGMGYYLIMQNNRIHDYTNAAGIGSISEQEKGLYEDNEIYNQTSGTIGVVFAMKGSVKRSTIRHNYVHDINSGSICGASANGNFGEWPGSGISEENEICFNLFEIVTGGYQAGRYNNSGNQGTLWSYRNTYVGAVAVQNQTVESCEGPFYFKSDVIQNSTSEITTNYSACNSYVDLLMGVSDIVDNSGFLINRSHVGTYGWEIAENEYWDSGGSDTTPPANPTALSVS